MVLLEFWQRVRQDRLEVLPIHHCQESYELQQDGALNRDAAAESAFSVSEKNLISCFLYLYLFFHQVNLIGEHLILDFQFKNILHKIST